MNTANSRIANDDFPVWHFPLNRAHAGVKLGNNRTGLLVWGGGDTLHLSIGVPTLWDHDGGAEWREGQSYQAIRKVLEKGDKAGLREIFPPTAKTPQLCPMGRVILTFKGRRLDTATLDIHLGTLLVRFAGRKPGALLLGVDWESGVVFARMSCGDAPRVEMLPSFGQPRNEKTLRERGFEPPRVEADGFEQRLPHDDAAGLAVARRGRAVFAAVARDGSDALAAARAKAAAAAATGFAALRARTSARWAAFWKDVPRVSIPNRTLQYVFDYGMYQFGAATDEGAGAVAAPLQGPWYADDCIPPWGGDYHFNINLQEYYWPAYHGNRLEHLRPVFDMIASWMPRLRANAKVFVGIDDGVMLPHAVDDTGKVMTANFWTGMMDHGATMWMADMMWRYYAFGGAGGRRFLRNQAMPFMKGAFNVFWKMLDREPGGALSLPVGPSPEYRGAEIDAWGRNASFQLVAAHRLAENLQEAARALRVAPDPRWEDLLRNLPKASLYRDPASDKLEIGLWDGLTLEYSHRHHSHLAGIFPFDVFDPDDPEWHSIVSYSIWRWLHFGPAYWSGWSIPWASIISARVGNADAAEFLLEFWERFFVNEGRGTLHDCNAGGLNMMGRPPLEADASPDNTRDVIQFDAAGASVAAVLELLCQERRGVTWLFRGAPSRWLDVSFDGIRTTGGVLVSAARKNGVVRSIRLTAAAGPCKIRLANPWSGGKVEVDRNGRLGNAGEGEILEIALRKAETVMLRPKGRLG